MIPNDRDVAWKIACIFMDHLKPDWRQSLPGGWTEDDLVSRMDFQSFALEHTKIINLLDEMHKIVDKHK